MSWAIGERLDPQSVKGEPLNFHQVQSIDRESERFEDVGESIEVFAVTIGTTATAPHDGHGVIESLLVSKLTLDQHGQTLPVFGTG